MHETQPDNHERTVQEIQNADNVMNAEVTRKLRALREGLALTAEWSSRPSIISRLKKDIDALVSNCRELWESVSEYDDFDEFHEMSSFRTGRYYEIRRSEWGDAHQNSGNRSTFSRHNLSTEEDSPYAGSTLAASVSSSIASLLPTVIIATQSTFATLVPVGTQVALPTYALSSSGQMVLDHYSVLTASSPIMGWYSKPVCTLPLSTVPVFVGTFAVAHALDSLHSYMNHRCSAKDAVSNVLKGSIAGAVVGGAYYGTIAAVGMAHAPIVSAGLCIGWLLISRGNKGDIALGTIANLAGVTTFLVWGSAWLSLVGALGANLAGSSLLTWLSQKWSERLNSRLSLTASEILGVPQEASRTEIESAFRHLARQYHPDKVGGDREYFELISVSKDILLHNLETGRKKKGESSIVSEILSIARWVADSFLNVSAEPVSGRNTRRPIELPSDFLDSPD
jgi:hypothetical protein